MIQNLYDQMLNYLKMEEEIEFKEFDSYYKEVLSLLEKEYQQYDQEQALWALFIMDNIKTNSDSRAQRKFAEAKKYKKISQRAQIWVEALFIHLVKSGMTDKEIHDKIEAMYEAA
ncbi:hypothetical protein [Ammoniphilus sp. CFH 90114]|uniref:hypothetical protein n=1 Tax=Ammoniphilus sp. CFH 90114 TaxID=2493665 RepID=UPI00100FBB15|nr:hypothetical protein [Ammoniphilus sp. CFH 90114]RXT13848.1 hypothetical protein EIZ39_06825 [Ammoniphilus sp. CFH 90114]